MTITRTPKPWGEEIWWAQTDFYLSKRVNLSPHQRTSLHYHRVKLENMLCMEGEGSLILDSREIPLSPGDSFRIDPGIPHRLQAGPEGLKILEVSTNDPEDVVRVQDDYDRMQTVETLPKSPRCSPSALFGSVSLRPSELGEAMHNAAFHFLGLPFHYVAWGTSQLDKTVDALKVLHVRGFGVGAPFKEAVLDFVDDLLDPVQMIGAANTVLNMHGRLVAANTDYTGITEALREISSPLSGRALVVGAGGMARAVCYALTTMGCVVTVCNRSQDRAEKITQLFGLSAPISFDQLSSFDARAGDIVVNATSLGDVASDTLPIPPQLLSEGVVLVDVVSRNTASTNLVACAQQRGCRVVTGHRIRLHQAAAQFALYTGLPAPVDVMERALNSRLENAQ